MNFFIDSLTLWLLFNTELVQKRGCLSFILDHATYPDMHSVCVQNIWFGFEQFLQHILPQPGIISQYQTFIKLI